MLAATGSTMTAAISLPSREKISLQASKSLYGASSVSATTASGTPGVPGTEKVATPDPAAARKGSAWPW